MEQSALDELASAEGATEPQVDPTTSGAARAEVPPNARQPQAPAGGTAPVEAGRRRRRKLQTAEVTGVLAQLRRRGAYCFARCNAATAQIEPRQSPKLLLPPGLHLRRLLVFLLTTSVVINIVDPVLAEVHLEWTEAVAAGRTKLWPIRLRAYLFVVQHLAYALWRAIRD